MQIDDESLRLIANMENYYSTWRAAARDVAAGRLVWKRVGDADYLYRVRDRQGNGTSLGRRSGDTEALMVAYETAKATQDHTWARLQRDGAFYRSAGLPRIPSYAAEVLRQFDISGLLGTSVLVVGTNAVCAYMIEAGMLLDSSMDATEDFDLTWLAAPVSPPPAGSLPAPLISVLKQIDSTYTINTERSFQARNSKGQEVELLMAASLSDSLPRYETFRPIPLPEQDWLLPGRRISHVVCGYDGLPARVEVPDPRWFALHKLWLSDKPSRNPLKKGKDRRQGQALLQLVNEHMPHYALDAAFVESLPAELERYFQQWKTEFAPDE